ncbi:hypothetical protein N7448_006409 [Penicillium atrosanguineum]|uniref:Uncharacterized protein n=1 Tax=Penicillium atrosanguineum TaxID=1132637 RepID=A0A9W9GZK7_9EURO|nr:uncharacterized protein N7443_010169 [Penicillium atrosanguineum]KAJ5132251.1 hypothetical protein N7448_006409 [Penicillium atrosanguineum]KAJ5137538.1 hypothetical protein N7526_003771 [Penicillium atrosanguineum]KAJ5289916.1 hypothetical protein N7443_010169 [Penicillium atrosanguineum]KAJ5307740.1 hypothetical protein N7476_008396 [Penicillium atrosanguineum]
MERVDENERVEGWKEQLKEEKREGGVDLRRQNMVRGRAERDNSGAGLHTETKSAVLGVPEAINETTREMANMALLDPGGDTPGS